MIEHIPFLLVNQCSLVRFLSLMYIIYFYGRKLTIFYMQILYKKLVLTATFKLQFSDLSFFDEYVRIFPFIGIPRGKYTKAFYFRANAEIHTFKIVPLCYIVVVVVCENNCFCF